MTLLTIMAKDLRLLWRDRAGLIFLSLAPIVVITVAGLSLANLYGADPTGQTAYEFPVVDEDGGKMSRELVQRLATERTVHLRAVANRFEAESLVRSKRAGSALVIPAGTEDALRAGRPASMILYVDSVKYLERINVRARLLDLRDALTGEERADMSRRVDAQRERVEGEVEQLRDAITQARTKLHDTWNDAARQRSAAAARIREESARAQRTAEQAISRQLDAARDDFTGTLQAQIRSWQAPVRQYLDTVQARRAEFERWFAELKRLAGSRADNIPPPPAFPELPADLAAMVQDDGALRLPTPAPLALKLPPPPRIDLPPLPEAPTITIPDIQLPEPPPPPGTLAIQEIDVSGGTGSINTFDQNVPGFSVTFLLLGMLLGVSLGLLDERDWGTFERLRAMPVAVTQVLGGKLLSRFVVGFVQMLVLLAIGWLAFDVSLGPQPWALLLPVIGIVFAGTSFGLIVAAVASSREAVLPVGSIVIVTMAAVGGCWWPIDLEPRWMRTVALAFPTTWAMDAFNDLMIRRRPVQVALLPTAVMLAYGCLYLVIGLALFRRRLR